MLEHNRVIFREVSRDQLVSDYYLLVLYMSGACSNTSSVGFWTRAHANRGHRARSSIPRVFEMSYLSMRKRLGGRSTLEQGSTRLLGHLGNDWARVRSSMLEQSEHGCAYARAERARLFLYSSMPSISLGYARACSCTTLLSHLLRVSERAQLDRSR